MFSKIFSLSKGKTVHSNRTICELHRELYDLCFTGLYDKDIDLMVKIIKILEDNFIMGIKMNRQLVRYKLGSSSKWEKKEYRNNDVSRKEIIKRREERKKLEKLLKDNNKMLRKFNKEKK